MPYSIQHNTPAQLDPIYIPTVTGDFDPAASLKATMIDPLYTPLNANTQVTVTDDQGNDIDADRLTELMIQAIGPDIQPDIEKDFAALYGKALIHFDDQSNMTLQQVFANQACVANRLPTPNHAVVYTTSTDVIPAAKELLAGAAHDGSRFFTSIANVFTPKTLGFWFKDDQEFQQYTQWIGQQHQIIASRLDADTNRLFQQFQQIDLKGLTESFIIRSEPHEENHEYSFARVIMTLTMQYLRQSNQANPQQLNNGVMPFSTAQLFVPETMVFVNVEKHARASARKINSEWNIINTAINMPNKVMSHRQLSQLTAVPRAAARAAAQHAATTASNSAQKQGRSGKIAFRKKPPKTVNIYSDVLKIVKKMGNVNRSQNTAMSSRPTMARANRRDPDNYDKPGVTTSVQYYPDIHIFLDCSGSIHESHYQDAIMMLIKLAKKLNINLYFSSYSHYLTQPVMLKVKNKSVNTIWKNFQKIPKAHGGTDYMPIWAFINERPERKKRLNINITDFDWIPPSHKVIHPKNLYYAPVSINDWSTIKHLAQSFNDHMMHIEPMVAKKFIGMR